MAQKSPMHLQDLYDEIRHARVGSRFKVEFVARALAPVERAVLANSAAACEQPDISLRVENNRLGDLKKAALEGVFLSSRVFFLVVVSDDALLYGGPLMQIVRAGLVHRIKKA
jgi:hypothetical protein